MLGAFHRATQPHRVCILFRCQQGANFAFNAVPSQAHGAMLPMSFVTACQLRLRLPLSLLQGITTCVCGAAVDCHGDHCLSCRHLQTHRTPWHNLVEHAAAGMARHARYHVPHDSRRPRATSAVYSPHYCLAWACMAMCSPMWCFPLLLNMQVHSGRRRWGSSRSAARRCPTSLAIGMRPRRRGRHGGSRIFTCSRFR